MSSYLINETNQHIKSHKTPPSRRGLSRTEAAVYIGISPSTFDKQVAAGEFPKPFRIGTRTLWDIRKIDEAIDAFSEEEFNPWDSELGEGRLQ